MDIILYPNFIMKLLHTVYMLVGVLVGESNSHTSPCICTTVPCPVVGNNSLEEGGGGAGVYQYINHSGFFSGKHSVRNDYVKGSGYGNRNDNMHPGIFSDGLTTTSIKTATRDISLHIAWEDLGTNQSTYFLKRPA